MKGELYKQTYHIIFQVSIWIYTLFVSLESIHDDPRSMVSRKPNEGPQLFKFHHLHRTHQLVKQGLVGGFNPSEKY